MAADTSFIRQINTFGGVNVTSDIQVFSDIGEVTSGMLTADTSIFQLYTTYAKIDNTTELLKLDEKTVGTFLPRVTIQTFSEDPHVPTCTRADKTYGVTVKVRGLLTGDLIPSYAKTILVGAGYKCYSPITFTPTGDAGNYADSWVYRTNGTFTDAAVIQRIPGGSPTLAVGAESFSAYIIPGSGTNLGQLATAEVIVWPVAIAAIEGIEAGKTYSSLPQNGTVVLRYAYPRSTTYAQIYKGPQQLGTAGMTIPSTIKTYGSNGDNSEVPQNATMPIEPLSTFIKEGGEYTIEVLTITPFNHGAPERLAYVSFVIHRAIRLRSMMVTGE